MKSDKSGEDLDVSWFWFILNHHRRSTKRKHDHR